jgi:Fuc2NAc and GlcNAc transferase
VVRRLALSHGVLDVPNARSSHTAPTPRGGGLAIVLVASLSMAALAAMGSVDFRMFMALTVGGIPVALVGFIDDRRPVSPLVRLLVHFAAAGWALAWLGGMPPLRLGGQTYIFGWEGYFLGAVGIVWTLNLFNFMDGIDGIAGAEAVFVTWAAAFLAQITGTPGVAPAAVAVGAACAGFLLWNWPPAKIFMGDVGSGYVGYAIVILALAASRDNAAALIVWLILGGIFFVDATLTVVRRLTRGEPPQQAHRSHAYQWLARRWGSHRRVTLTVLGLNFFWLLPWAVLAARFPAHAALFLCVAFVPLAVVVLLAGAGRAEPDANR